MELQAREHVVPSAKALPATHPLVLPATTGDEKVGTVHPAPTSPTAICRLVVVPPPALEALITRL